MCWVLSSHWLNEMILQKHTYGHTKHFGRIPGMTPFHWPHRWVSQTLMWQEGKTRVPCFLSFAWMHMKGMCTLFRKSYVKTEWKKKLASEAAKRTSNTFNPLLTTLKYQTNLNHMLQCTRSNKTKSIFSILTLTLQQLVLIFETWVIKWV